ncbi:hypothetical protein LTR37_011323 [Vermiconidia calcicola]|uniref:Uncharacterized protein n=1 Tax=Vermiconidia calcicola TaxID=1690605 RepID=A0ACC3N2Q1_9PEZI|nr:hypothetical protein LTR37_011323 [Vermiconidia calcicola]
MKPSTKPFLRKRATQDGHATDDFRTSYSVTRVRTPGLSTIEGLGWQRWTTYVLTTTVASTKAILIDTSVPTITAVRTTNTLVLVTRTSYLVKSRVIHSLSLWTTVLRTYDTETVVETSLDMLILKPATLAAPTFSSLSLSWPTASPTASSRMGATLPHEDNKPISIGLSVAGALIMVALCLTGFYFWKKRRQTSERAAKFNARPLGRHTQRQRWSKTSFTTVTQAVDAELPAPQGPLTELQARKEDAELPAPQGPLPELQS